MADAGSGRFRARHWWERLMLAAAALAAVATSQPRWQLKTKPAPEVLREGKGHLLEVEASSRPWVYLERDGLRREASAISGQETWPHHPEPDRSWKGRDSFFIPAGWSVANIEVMGVCNGGCGECVPPSEAFVRVAKVSAVETWTLEAVSEPIEAIGSTHRCATFEVTVDASQSVFIDLQPTSAAPPGSRCPWVPDSRASGRRTQEVCWCPEGNPPPFPRRGMFRVRVVAEGTCTGSAPCVAPPEAHVRIEQVRAK